MKSRTLFACLLLLPLAARAQPGTFNLEAYRAFLESHRNLSAQALQALYPAGEFSSSIPNPGGTPDFLDTVRHSLGLNGAQVEALGKYGFVVVSPGLPSRSPFRTMSGTYRELYTRDLPAFVSTDAILQAIHASYNGMLIEMETGSLVPLLRGMLDSLHAQLRVLASVYAGEERMLPMLRDVDVYLTVPRRLYGESISPVFPEDAVLVDSLLSWIQEGEVRKVLLFAAEGWRRYDFSQFTVRGHYTKSVELGQYFQAMIWLGRTDLVMSVPGDSAYAKPNEDVQRQCVDALLLTEAVEKAGMGPTWERVDSLLGFLVGESDNVRVPDLVGLREEVGISKASDLLDSARYGLFQSVLATKSFAGQKINSQIIMTNAMGPAVVLPSVFKLLGQRFVVDAYVTGNVVYDRIEWEGKKVCRMLPATLDVLAALGNNAAIQLLQPELTEWQYASNLAALRYLVDSFDEAQWDGTLFNRWIQMIRTLNPPADRSTLPTFMQTGAWWQEKMNTQLGSWAQLRHDNLLYVKQPYTPGIILCSFPESYVEPIPAFYAAVKRFASKGDAVLGGKSWSYHLYFAFLGGVADTLEGISSKELSGTALTPEETRFLRSMVVRKDDWDGGGCGGGVFETRYFGWYPRLYYGQSEIRDPLRETAEFVVADIHTAPTDERGDPVGWVVHVGTGLVDLAVVAATTPAGRRCVFVGPVFGYSEYVTTNFKRLTDEEWNAIPSHRPEFVNGYAFDSTGLPRAGDMHLLTAAGEKDAPPLAAEYALHPNYPNPFNPSTILAVSVSSGAGVRPVRLEVFDVSGRLVKTLLNGPLGPGTYLVRWDGSTSSGKQAASGFYIARMTAGGTVESRKMLLVK